MLPKCLLPLALLAAALLAALLSGLLRGRLLRLRSSLRLLRALAATDLALLASHVAVAVQVIEVLAVVHLDAGGRHLRGLALRLARLLPRRRPDVAALDVIHH